MREFWFGFIGSVLGVLAAGALIVVSGAFVVSGLIASTFQDTEFAHAGALPDEGIIIEIDLRYALDQDSAGPFLLLEGFNGATFSSNLVEDALFRAASDPRVDGVLVTTGASVGVSRARAESMASTLRHVSASGKVVHTHLSAALAGMRSNLLIATAGDSSSASPFDTLGLDDEFYWEGFENPGPAFDQAFLHALSMKPQIDTQLLADSFATGYLQPERALEVGLFDQIESHNAVRDNLLAPPGRTAIPYTRYMAHPDASDRAPQFAHVRVPSKVTNSFTDYLDILHSSANDPQVDAIILEFNANRQLGVPDNDVALAVEQARQAGKPVIVFLAGQISGFDYRNLANADRIVMPANGMIHQIGSQDSQLPPAFLQQGAAQSPDAELRLEMQRYAGLVEAIAEARDLPMVRVDELGRGQSWSGVQAVEVGLADEVGGLPEAVNAARALAGIPSDLPVELVTYPGPATHSDRFAQRLGFLLFGEP